MKAETQDENQKPKEKREVYAPLALANMIAQGVKMADAKKRLGIK